MAPSAIDPREEQKRNVTSARVRTNGITKNTATKPKMNKTTEDLVRPIEGLVIEKTANSSSTIETTNTVYNDVFSNLRGHFQKADIVKSDVAKSDVAKSGSTTTAVKNKLAKKIIDQDEDAAYNMIKAHFSSMSSGGKGRANKWSFLIQLSEAITYTNITSSQIKASNTHFTA
ncbi:uncharacterized protein Bfra_010597 [Botrytis fragariae]|uniref:Uncharacterized protein n=1 Tax=Botrytis fragariae TaxID=1964551 RepID=A0A8H6AGS6_9HELO|nr:uncharacterized protein Bfra_010597 [Botrytis fragariae]KAF5867622.1 hypothetical protein Bfra_010597 [Botrytis fragariae]